jgi:hypothetical protein
LEIIPSLWLRPKATRCSSRVGWRKEKFCQFQLYSCIIIWCISELLHWRLFPACFSYSFFFHTELEKFGSCSHEDYFAGITALHWWY